MIIECRISTPQFHGSRFNKTMFEQNGEFDTETLLFKTWDKFKYDGNVSGHNVQFRSMKDFRKAQLTQDKVIQK